MVSILIPLIIYILLLFIIIFLIKICFKIYCLIITNPTTILYYKINNVLLSFIVTVTFVKFFILVVYLLRLYNMPHNIDLKRYYYFLKEVTLFPSTPFLIKSSIFLVLLLFCLLLFLLLIWFHKTISKEIYRLYIYFCYDNYLEKNKYTRKIYIILHNFGLLDLLQYFVITFTFYLTNVISGKNHNFFTLPKYHFYKIIPPLVENKYYPKIMAMSPIIVFLYDCIYNNFIITHLFYYLLFYIPFKLIHRASFAIGSNSYYLSLLTWEICYGKQKWLYAISEKYKVLFDHYVALYLYRNYDFSDTTELFFYDHIRFGLIDKKDLIYENPDGIQIKKVGNNFFEIIENEEGNMVLGEQWYVLIDKTDNKIHYYNKEIISSQLADHSFFFNEK